MSAAAAAVPAPAPAGKGKKKLIIILVALLLVVGLGAGGAVFMMKKNAAAAAAAAEDGDEAAPAAHKADGASKEHPPTYVALDPFTVNLADKEAERFAQIAVTLEVDDPKFAEQMKGYMPSIRSGILMILAHKTSAELLERAGKDALANEIMRESVRPLGIEVEPEDAEAADEDEGKKKKKKKKKATVHNPVTHVHFANFIIQ